MQIFLQILSVIGIIVLCILAVLLVLLLLVLLVPIRYRIQGYKNTEEWQIAVKATFLLHLIRLRAVYPNPGTIQLKILFFPVFTDKGARQEPSFKTTKKSKHPPKEKETDTAEECKTPKREETVTEETPEKVQEDASQTETFEATGEEKNKKRFSLIDKIKEKWAKIKYTIRSVCDKITHILHHIGYYYDLFTEEETRQLFHKCFKRFGTTLRSILPRKIEADVLFGTGSPDTTGYLLAAYSMIYPFLHGTVNLVPDFEQAVLEGHLSAKGKIRIAVFVKLALIMLLDKNIKLFIQKWKREDI